MQHTCFWCEQHPTASKARLCDDCRAALHRCSIRSRRAIAGRTRAHWNASRVGRAVRLAEQAERAVAA